MTPMIEFTREILTLLAQFLEKEPIFYLYGMVLSLLVVKLFMMIIKQD
jgi:hypothetical protein